MPNPSNPSILSKSKSDKQGRKHRERILQRYMVLTGIAEKTSVNKIELQEICEKGK